MIKRLLFFCLTLLFFISVPCDSFAAPRKESRKERRERKKTRTNDKVQRPVKQKITPTLEEKLSPAQVTKKIQTIRRRVETAPENIFPAKDKRIFLEVFDDMIQTKMGRYIFEKAHPDLSFRVKQMERTTNGSYGYRSRCINLASGIFEQIRNAKTPDEKLSKQLYLAHVIAHEATHSIQHVNNMNDKSNMSFEEMITINKVFELNSILNQTIVRYQVANLLKYRASAESGKLQIVPMHRFYKELFDAYKTTGFTDDRAHRAARTKFVETFWQNNGAIHIFIGDRKIIPCEEVIDNWQSSYSSVGFCSLVGNKTPQPMHNRGIESKLRRFTIAMNIDTLPAFFRNPETTPFKMETSKRMITYFNGAKMHEFDALAAGVINKGYKNGKLWFIIIDTTHPEIASEDRSYTDYHEGTRTPKATYTYKNGKMNGIYREYDRQGRQIMEVPVKDDSVKGDGWILEDDKRVFKVFYADNYFRNKVQRPVKQKITPTLEEELTPKQVQQKIKTIRRRIETAPENIISNKDKPFLLEIFDDIAQTQMGRYIFEKTHPDLMFCVKPIESSASYAFGPKCINLNKNYFKENQTPEERCKIRLYLSQSIAHEATHGIQHVNDMMNCGKISFEERITITKISELHALLNESIISYQLSKQPHYKAAVKAGKTEIAPVTRFYAELFDAYKTTGLSDAKAAKAARTKFVETFWQNNGEKSIQIGEKTVFPCEEVIQNWHISYSTYGFRGLQGNKTPYREAMRHRGIERFLRQFTQSMDIDTPPSFFRNPQTTAFHMPTSKRLLTYANGILNTEMDALTTGMITKGYRSGIRAKGRKKGEPYYILIKTLHPQIASQNRSYTEYHEGTNIKRATYTYKNGKMNGIYREYDLQGRQIMEVPVQNDNVNGEGWVMENGKKVLKTFFDKALLRNRKQ